MPFQTRGYQIDIDGYIAVKLGDDYRPAKRCDHVHRKLKTAWECAKKQGKNWEVKAFIKDKGYEHLTNSEKQTISVCNRLLEHKLEKDGKSKNTALREIKKEVEA